MVETEVTEAVMATACPVCDTTSAKVFTELLNLPIYCNLLWRDRAEAIACPKGDIRLAFCSHCGAITNTAFDPSKLGYAQDYENSLHYSRRFQAYAQELAERLVKKHQLKHKTIVEIGCGKGDFLVSLCEMGDNTGIGFDNSYVARDEHEALGDRVQFIQDFYTEKYAHYSADFVCCRQVLEHVKRPRELLIPLRKALRKALRTALRKAARGQSETAIFFEVPNALYTFSNMMIWDIIYEHCTYFTPVSLTYAFNAAGYETSAVTEEFGRQFISVEAHLASEDFATASVTDIDALAELTATIEGFEAQFKVQKQQWKASLDRLFAQGKKVVIWGAGSKGVTFLNLLGLEGRVEYAVDINPRKQGKFIPGTGQEIVPPERMRQYRPDVVIVMNPLYQQEIKSSLSQMSLYPQVVTTESFTTNRAAETG